jgi:hypothetical protein
MTALIKEMEAEGAYPAGALEQRQGKRDLFAVHSDVGSGAFHPSIHPSIHPFIHSFIARHDRPIPITHLPLFPPPNPHPHQRAPSSNAPAPTPRTLSRRRLWCRTCCRACPGRKPSASRTPGMYASQKKGVGGSITHRTDTTARATDLPLCLSVTRHTSHVKIGGSRCRTSSSAPACWTNCPTWRASRGRVR